MRRTDSEIQQAVLRELKWDTRVEAADVWGVEVDNGVVTLSGTVATYAKRVAAQEAAHRVAGVMDVANDLTVKLPGGAPNDTELAAAVRRALEWDVSVPDKRIRSTVSHGWVTLEGDVDYWSERDDAWRVVSKLNGVRGVTVKVEVKPAKPVPQDVRKAIEDALERHAEREAKRIGLAVSDGQVTLSGVVHSWAEREAVVGAAKGTVGVRKVEDRLRIEPRAA